MSVPAIRLRLSLPKDDRIGKAECSSVWYLRGMPHSSWGDSPQRLKVDLDSRIVVKTAPINIIRGEYW
jgi:hypothetical protein